MDHTINIIWILMMAVNSSFCWKLGLFTVDTELPKNCGKTDYYNATSKYLNPGAWPWLGLLSRSDTTEKFCNAILIHSEVAVSSSACIGTNTNDNLRIRFSTMRNSQIAYVSEVHFLSDNSQVNNIGIMKLDRKVRFDSNVQPICLSEQDDDSIAPLTNQIGIVSGTYLSNVSNREIIFQAAVTINDAPSCSNSNRNYYESLLDGSVCLNYRDTSECHQIGSALMLPGLNDVGNVVWFLRGIQTTRVWYCGGGTFTPSFDLAPHRKWIDSHFGRKQEQSTDTSNKSPPSGCGRRIISETPLIVRGNETSRGDWPWHVALYNSNSTQVKKYASYICGGSLISDKFIVTAAHCLTYPGTNEPMPTENLIALIGKYDLSRKEPGAVIGEAVATIVHEEYDGRTFVNDIGLIVLNKPLQFSNYIQPVCLWDSSDVNKRNIFNKNADIPGWGLDEMESVRTRLKAATIPIIDDVECIQSHETFFLKNLSNRTFCAGGRSAGSSVCNGDSGGGLVMSIAQNDGIDSYFLRGLVSLSPSKPGKRTCDPNHYVLFTDVAYYLDWIQSKMSSARFRR